MLNYIKYLVVLFCFLILNISCKSQSVHEQRLDIIHQALLACNKYDTVAFKTCFEDKSNLGDVKFEIARIYYILSKYHYNKIDSLEWFTDGKVDPSTNLTNYQVKLFDGFDSLTGYKQVNLHFFFLEL